VPDSSAPAPTNNDASVIDSSINNNSGIDATNNEAIPFVVGQKIMAKDSLNKWFVASHHQYESCIQIYMFKKIFS
jgi:hypothetical protein